MKTKSFVILIITLLTWSCKDNGSEPRPSIDELLAQALIASSSSGSNYQTEYRPDGTFNWWWKSWYLPPAQPDTFTLFTSGMYRVTDGVLYRYDVHWSYVTQSGHPRAFGTIDYPRSLAIRGDSLYQTMVEVLNPIGGTRAELSGSWSSTLWEYVASDSSFTPYAAGRVIHTYTFFPDSMRAHERWEHLDGSLLPTYNVSTDYTYNSSILRVGNSLAEPMRVEFRNGQMLLYHDQ